MVPPRYVGVGVSDGTTSMRDGRGFRMVPRRYYSRCVMVGGFGWYHVDASGVGVSDATPSMGEKHV